MGWLWIVGSLKIHLSFAEYSLFYRALLHTRPMFLTCSRLNIPYEMTLKLWLLQNISLFHRALLQKRPMFWTCSRLNVPYEITLKLTFDLKSIIINKSTLGVAAIKRQLQSHFIYGVATISRLPNNIGLFCKRAPQKRLYSANVSCRVILYGTFTYINKSSRSVAVCERSRM